MSFRHLAGFTWAANIDPTKEFEAEFYVDSGLVLSRSRGMDPDIFTGKLYFHFDAKLLR